ncbi:ATP-dependent Clp protease proteolytic subunit-related protein 1, chloroplastic-like [Zingiber officinale]|uniref:ATP-dependent Clp protease proteolytic subunit-related protein 1, chloroplastic-like n=1 Tax=Zingiber officinale TaxID=94328 RepID=UPI001C4C1C0A|nr:ATP-dependent Clp protease proteolytic subunit-related protein 1, chloroplastic-like [Zingiber officinale]
MSIALRTLSVSSSFDNVSGFPKNSFWNFSKVSPSTRRSIDFASRKRVACRCESRSSNNYDHIPRKFREENLKEGLKQNYESFPQSMYGLTPSQMDMFLTEDNPVTRQATKVTEESISSARSYIDNGGMYSLNGLEASSNYNMSVSMYRGGGRGYGRLRSAPPDLPSLLLDARIVYLGMPMVPAVTELLVAQFMWLDYDDSSKPIYLYINSSGTQNVEGETVGSETEAYAIADMIAYVKPKVYTINVGMAYGQAAMLLSLGAKGFRGLQPNSSTKLYLPKVYKSSGAATDMWIKAKELDANTEYLLELLAKGIGKPKEEIKKDIELPRYFDAQEAIAYGIADKTIKPEDDAFEKKNYDEQLAKSKAMRKATGAGPQATPSGFR